jgi:N-acetylglucosamine kinase-like BadF-type ATPase
VISGDWGGGYDVGLAAISAAARSEDGRGPRTSLERAVPAYFGLATPVGLAEAIHRRQVPMRRVTELAPVVLAEAEHDGVAGSIVARLAAEVVAMVRVALERLGLTQEPVDVVLGGGVLRAGNSHLLGAVEAGLVEVAPLAAVRATSSPPIVGAALLGLDALAAGPDAQVRLRAELDEAFARLENGRNASA